MTFPDNPSSKKIIIRKNGPYTVMGGIPLVRKTPVISEYGEPIAWRKEMDYHPAEEPYDLCRCGNSKNKPFCDGSHRRVGFNGTETADTNTTAERRVIYRGSRKIIVRRDLSLCMSAGFCGNRLRDVHRMVQHLDDDTILRSLAIAMMERCPSGSYTYQLAGEDHDNEPDLPQQIAVTTEMTEQGVIIGPLWVTGYIPVERSDGQPFETRNRVTLCRCGQSKSMPLCDGTHRQKLVREE
jgi:CDGSH-type Zn-finger protein